MKLTTELPITHPVSESEFAQRDKLLKLSLRDDRLPWNYDQEYPLVLAQNTYQFSWCVKVGDTITAHANLWPRRLHHVSSPKSYAVGFIGNVATHPDFRGQGHMHALLRHLENIAQRQNLSALILWSDLLEFYQNLGFRSIGREIRFHIRRQDRLENSALRRVHVDSLSDSDLQAMLELRPRLEWNLERGIDEFRSLLAIPETHLFMRRQGQRVLTWIIVGRGMDMQGVIHEWGSATPESLIGDIHSLMNSENILELILLASAALAPKWLLAFQKVARSQSSHGMALAKALDPQAKDVLKALQRAFIWGLDSI